MKLAGKRSAGKPRAAFDVAGTGNVTIGRRIYVHDEKMDPCYRPLLLARQYSTLPEGGEVKLPDPHFKQG